MNRILLALLFCTLVLTSCFDDPPTADTTPSPTPHPADLAIGYARDIVSDPSNWKANSALLTKLGEEAQDLGIEQTPEFVNFDAAVRNLISFGTSWVTNLNEGTFAGFKSDLTRITSKTESSAVAQLGAASGMNPSTGQININSQEDSASKELQAEAEHAIYTNITGLRAAQADQFGKLYERAQSSFRALRLRLQTKVNGSDAKK